MNIRKWIAALVPLALLVPTASHAAAPTAYDGIPSNGIFDPRVDIINSPLNDQPSKIVPSITETAGHDPFVTGQITIPGAWRFSVESITPARNRANTAPATVCSDLITGTGQSFTTAEVLGNGGRFSIQNDNTVGRGDPTEYDAFQGELGFLNWNSTSQTANLCFHVAPYVTNPAYRYNIPAANRDFVFPIALHKNTSGDWEIAFDLTNPIYANSYFNGAHSYVVNMQIEIDALSKGNWNKNTSGALTKVVFSRTPIAPGAYGVHSTFTTCSLTGPGACQSDKGPVTVDNIVNIVTGFSGTHMGAILSGPAKFAVFRNVKTNPGVAISWNAPAQPADHVVTAYGIEISVPHRDDLAHYETVPALGCTACTKTFNFPLSNNQTLGAAPLPVDGKYAVTLWTIYQDGHRSDGRCDNGTIAGLPAPCAGENTLPGVGAVPKDSREFMTRGEAWPLAFQGGYSGQDLLLVDYSSAPAKMQYVVWQANNPATLVYSASSAGVQGSNDLNTGTVIANVQAAGSTRGIALDLEIDITGGANGIITEYNLSPSAPNLDPEIIPLVSFSQL